MPDDKNVLKNFDWPSMLSFAAKNLKFQKNAVMLNDMVVNLSHLDAGIKEAIAQRDTLLSHNDELRRTNSGLLRDKDESDHALNTINNDITAKQAKVDELEKIIRTNIKRRKEQLESEFNNHKRGLDDCRKKIDKEHKTHCEALDAEIKLKQGQLDDIDAKRKEMADKLNESV